MKKYQFVEYEPIRSLDGKFIIGQEDHQVLRSRREQLGLTQQQVSLSNTSVWRPGKGTCQDAPCASALPSAPSSCSTRMTA